LENSSYEFNYIKIGCLEINNTGVVEN